MRASFLKGVVAAAIVLLVVPAAFAQTTGRIDGRAHEAGTPLPGVNVTITSPAQQGTRTVTTDENGSFRFLGVAVGEYKLVAQLDGYATVEQAGIVVRLDKTVSVDIKMSAAIEETITVTGDSSLLIDHLSTTSGASFDANLIKELPINRNALNLAFAAPGVVDGGLGSNPSIGGASAAENRYVVDGLDTTDPAFGTIGTSFPTEFIQEIEIKTGGYEAEYGGALGGLLNVITKSGGNATSLDLFAYYSDDSLQSDTPPTQTVGQELGSEEQDFGAALGGKLIEDKLWYFVAVNHSETADLITTRGELIRTKDNDNETLFYTGKLTWQPNQSNQLTFSTFGDPQDETDVVRNTYGLLGTNDEFGATNYGVTYNSTIGSDMFLELAAGRYDEDVTAIPFADVPRYEQRSFAGTAASNPGLGILQTQPCGPITPGTDPFETTFNWTPTCLGATFAQENNDRSRDEIRGNFTWFGATGPVDHEIKIGGMVRQVDYTDDARYPGPAPPSAGGGIDETGFVYDPSGLRGQRWLLFNGFALMLEYQQASVGTTDEEAIYLQDSLRIGDYFTLNLGVRADSFESRGGGRDPITNEFVDVSALFPDRKLDFSFSDMVAPRIGFTADVTRDGRSKLYGHYGQFYESVPLDINARSFGTEIFNFYYFYYPSDGSLPNGSNPGTWFYSYPLGVGVGVSSDIEAMYTEETLVGFEYGVTDNVSVGVKYTERGIENVIEDISVDGGHTYFITNPGGTVTVNPVTGEVLDEPAIFPEPVRDYTAIELTLHKRFSNNWQLFASYVNSENKGNYGGLFRQDNGQLDPNITSLYDLPSLLVGANGLLPNDREHQFKVYGSYLTPINLVVGFYAQFLSGTPISKLGAHPIYGRSERFVTPRGSFGRTPDIYNLDLHFEYPIKTGNRGELKLIADIFNITDQQEPASVDQEWTFARLTATTDPNECGGPGTGPGTACPAGNPDFGSALDFQRPQTFRFGVKYSF